jgi:hypothetical protein
MNSDLELNQISNEETLCYVCFEECNTLSKCTCNSYIHNECLEELNNRWHNGVCGFCKQYTYTDINIENENEIDTTTNTNNTTILCTILNTMCYPVLDTLMSLLQVLSIILLFVLIFSIFFITGYFMNKLILNKISEVTDFNYFLNDVIKINGIEIIIIGFTGCSYLGVIWVSYRIFRFFIYNTRDNAYIYESDSDSQN